MSFVDPGAMLFIVHPGNVSTGDVTASDAAAGLLTGLEPQPLPHWANATQVNYIKRQT